MTSFDDLFGFFKVFISSILMELFGLAQLTQKFMWTNYAIYFRLFDPISGVMASVLASSAVDRGFDPDRVKPKITKLVPV